MFDPLPQSDGRDWGVLGTTAGWSWRFLVSAAGLALVVFVLIQLKFVVIPLLLALLVSSVLAPLMQWFERHGVGRGLAATLTVAVALAVLVGFVLLAVPPFFKHIHEFKAAFETTGDEFYAWLSGAPFSLSDTQIAHLRDGVTEVVPNLQTALLQGVKAALPLLAQIVTVFALTIVLTGYLLAGGDRYWQWLLGFFAPVNRPGINALGVAAYTKLAGYLRGTAVMALIYGVGIGLFAFLLGVELAVVLGIVVFVMAFLPIVGAWVSGFLVGAMAFVSGGIWTLAAMVAVIFLLSQINSIFLRPQIVGNRVSLVPVVTLTSVLMGTTIAGVIGGILAVPVVATISGTLGQVRRWRSEGGVPTADPIIDKSLDPDVAGS